MSVFISSSACVCVCVCEHDAPTQEAYDASEEGVEVATVCGDDGLLLGAPRLEEEHHQLPHEDLRHTQMGTGSLSKPSGGALCHPPTRLIMSPSSMSCHTPPRDPAVDGGMLYLARLATQGDYC